MNHGRRRVAAALAGAALLLPPLTLAPHLTTSTDVARLRNALVFREAAPAAFAWTPADMPRDFLRDSSPPLPEYTKLAHDLGLEQIGDDWTRARIIASHLLSSAPELVGGGVQEGLSSTLLGITRDGRGYCADFVRAFQALAGSAGLQSRAWAFSFDGYGGHGHVFPEIWNRQAERWQAIDIFNNVYFARPDGQPVSAGELRAALAGPEADLQVLPIAPKARPGFADPRKLWAYYRRGFDEWYLWWGTNPYDYDGLVGAEWGSAVLRPALQAAAIITGVQPDVVAYADERNAGQRDAMHRLKWQLLAVLLVQGLGLVGLVALLATRRRKPVVEGSHDR